MKRQLISLTILLMVSSFLLVWGTPAVEKAIPGDQPISGYIQEKVGVQAPSPVLKRSE